MQALDTHVDGDPDAIIAAADEFDRYGGQVDKTVDSLNSVNGRRERSWDGPASNACGGQLTSLRGDADQLHPQVQNATRAGRDLAGALKSVKDKMRQALDTARGAELQVQGELIAPPTPPGPAPPPPQGPVSPVGSNQPAGDAAAAQTAHQQACQHYNQQLAAFKRAKSLVDDARKQERNAHHEYQSKTNTVNNTVTQLKTIGVTGATWAASYVKGAHSQVTQLFEKAERIRNTGGEFAPLQAQLAEARGARRAKMIKGVPKWVREGVSKNPTSTFSKTFSEGSKAFRWAKPVAKGVPYVGTALNATSHVTNAVTGQESWGKAAAHFGAETAGGALGGAAAGAALGSVVPGVGTVIGGVVGGAVGSIGADKIVDFFWGD